MKKLFPVLILVLVGLWLWQQGGAPMAPSFGSAPGSPVSQPTPGTGGAAPEDSPAARDTPPAPIADADADDRRYPDFLPPEALDTLALIEADGPYPYRKDGSVFQNRERRLPSKPRGWYREYTVETPGSEDRGARRIVAGGDPVETYCYTDDHYRSFRCFEPSP